MNVLSCAVVPLPLPICARLESPLPMPHSARPPVSAAREANELASTAGSRVMGLVTRCLPEGAVFVPPRGSADRSDPGTGFGYLG